MASFIVTNEPSTDILEKSGLAIFVGAARKVRKLVCATRCHSNRHEWHRADPL